MAGRRVVSALVTLAVSALAAAQSDIVSTLDPAITARMAARLLPVGGQVPADVSVYDRTQQRVPAQAVFAADYTVLMTGCLTCPVFARTYPAFEALYADYRPKGVAFYYLYKHLEHPENHGYVEPFSIQERFAHVTEARGRFGTRVPWLTDPMSNEMSQALGGLPNAGYLFDREGRVVYASPWADAEGMRNRLAELVGPVTPPTVVAALRLPEVLGRSDHTRGVVPRVEVAELLAPIRITPIPGDAPFFAKLRAEVDPALRATGTGKMYLGFHLDPVHHVHWNNLADPLEYSLTLPKGTDVEPPIGRAPRVEAVASDIDPREFLVTVTQWSAEHSIDLAVRYFACDDQDRWCYPVTQRYTLHLEEPQVRGGVYDRSFRMPTR